MRRTLLLALALIGPLASSSARAEETPSPWWIGKLSAEFAGVSRIGVRTEAGRTVLWTPKIDSAGVSGYPGKGPPRLSQVSADVAGMPEPTLVPWTRIDAVEKPVNAAGRGAMLGAFTGTLAAVVVAVISENDEGSTVSDWLVPLMAGGGAGIGAAIGGARDLWRIVYPPDGTRPNAWDVRLKEIKP